MRTYCTSVLIAAALSASLAWSAAASDEGKPFVRPANPAAGTLPAARCEPAFPSSLPLRCWTGQQLIVLPQRENMRSFGYQFFKPANSNESHVDYAELAGKTVTVVSVRWYTEPSISERGWLIRFRADDTKRDYEMRAPTLKDGDDPDKLTVLDVALVRDLKEARARYLGRSYWTQRGELIALDDRTIRGVHFRKFRPIVISDVLASDNAFAPVRLVVKNDTGEEAYFDIAVSHSNGGGPNGVIGDEAVAQYLSASDPHQQYKFSAKVWDFLESGLVFVGMSKLQARMSWGVPQSVNRTITAGRAHEQWAYEYGKYLYFDSDSLTGIHD